jgi:RNA polymerase sigma factor (sigma-70 family)
MRERTPDKWPGPDDKQTVNQMLTDPYCDHWRECRSFFERLIQISSLPEDMKEDVVQNAMLSGIKNLSTFRFDCKLSTWLTYIARSRIADATRDIARINKQIIVQIEPLDDEENQTNTHTIKAPHTTEEICIIRENLSEVMSALREYLSDHAKPERNGQILLKVLFEQYTIQEVAKEFDVNVPVIRYIVDSFKRHLHKRSDVDDQGHPTETIL